MMNTNHSMGLKAKTRLSNGIIYILLILMSIIWLTPFVCILLSPGEGFVLISACPSFSPAVFFRKRRSVYHKPRKITIVLDFAAKRGKI